MHLLGEFPRALEHLEQGLALDDPQRDRPQVSGGVYDARVLCLLSAASALWPLGYPDQARQRSHEAVTSAREMAHPYTLAFTLTLTALLHQRRREGQAVQELVEEAIALSTERGFAELLALGKLLQAVVLTAQEHKPEDIAHLHPALDAVQARGPEHYRIGFFALLADAYRQAGQAVAGLPVLTQALALADQTGAGYYEAELHRIKGELLRSLALSHDSEAETCFHQALVIARHQQAKSWELRAATSLARLWQSQDKRQDAYDLLAPVYNWFTEGFDTADVQEAQALLETLAEESSHDP